MRIDLARQRRIVGVQHKLGPIPRLAHDLDKREIAIRSDKIAQRFETGTVDRAVDVRRPANQVETVDTEPPADQCRAVLPPLFQSTRLNSIGTDITQRSRATASGIGR